MKSPASTPHTLDAHTNSPTELTRVHTMPSPRKRARLARSRPDTHPGHHEQHPTPPTPRPKCESAPLALCAVLCLKSRRRSRQIRNPTPSKEGATLEDMQRTWLSSFYELFSSQDMSFTPVVFKIDRVLHQSPPFQAVGIILRAPKSNSSSSRVMKLPAASTPVQRQTNSPNELTGVHTMPSPRKRAGRARPRPDRDEAHHSDTQHQASRPKRESAPLAGCVCAVLCRSLGDPGAIRK